MSLSQCATDGHWCCGDLSSEACCALDSRFFLAATVGALSSTSKTLIRSTSSATKQGADSQSAFLSSGSKSISSPITSSTSTSTPTPTPTPTPSHSQTGRSAGLGAGIGVGVLALGIVIFGFIVRRRRRRRAREYQYQRSMEMDNDTAYGTPKYASNGTHLAQLGDESTRVTQEIDGTTTHEMDGANTQEMDGATTHEMVATSPCGRRQVNGIR